MYYIFLRQKEWIQILNIPEFSQKSPRTIEKQMICTTHFDPKYLITSGGKVGVTRNATPKLGVSDHFSNQNKENQSPSKSPMKKKARMVTAFNFLHNYFSLLFIFYKTSEIIMRMVYRINRQ